MTLQIHPRTHHLLSSSEPAYTSAPLQDSAIASTRAYLVSLSNYHGLPGTIRPHPRSAPSPLSSSARHQFTPERQGRGWSLKRKRNRVEAGHRLRTGNRRLAIARGSILAFGFLFSQESYLGPSINP